MEARLRQLAEVERDYASVAVAAELVALHRERAEFFDHAAAALERANRAAEAPGACSECGVPPGEPHRETCFFLTGDPADLVENQADG
jgi:hypothetical protein